MQFCSRQTSLNTLTACPTSLVPSCEFTCIHLRCAVDCFTALARPPPQPTKSINSVVITDVCVARAQELATMK